MDYEVDQETSNVVYQNVLLDLTHVNNVVSFGNLNTTNMKELMNHQRIETVIESALDDIIDDFDSGADREEVIDRLDEESDAVWTELVKYGRIDKYTVDDLTETASDCAIIIEFAEERAWVETDSGLWQGLTYGVLASIAYSSLRNCFYQLLKDRGHDTNDEFPFASESDD